MKNYIFISEVKLRTDKNGLIQILNTILHNVGDFRQLELSDSWELIVNTVEYINNSYSFNMLHLIDWDRCKSCRNFSPKQMSKRRNSVSRITKIVCDTDNYYGMELIIDWSENNLWEKAVTQYPNSSWAIDNICFREEYEEYQNGGKTPLYSTLMTNTNGQISISQVEINEISVSNHLNPIHLGHVHLLKLSSDITLFKESLYKKISTELYNNMLNTAQEIYDRELKIWTDYKNNEALDKDTVDCFSIFHASSDRIVKSWQAFNGTYCPISLCYSKQFKPLSNKKKKCKEVVIQPLWQ